MKRTHISLLLMIVTIFMVILGQIYWLTRLYNDEFRTFKKGIDAQFRTSFYQLQRERFLKDSFLFGEIIDTVLVPKENTKPQKKLLKKPAMGMVLEIKGRSPSDSLSIKDINGIDPQHIKSIQLVKSGELLTLPPELMETMIISSQKMENLAEITNDSSEGNIKIKVDGIGFNDSVLPQDRFLVTLPLNNETVSSNKKLKTSQKIPVIRLITNNKTLNDTIPLSAIKKYFDHTLVPDQINLAYQITRKVHKRRSNTNPGQPKDTLKGFITSAQLSGIKTPYSYQLLFPDIQSYIYTQMRLQIAGSVLMIIVLIIAFIFIYYTLLRQERLSDLKNEFINNITHELKTPIATVQVALEALHDFKAIDNPQKSKEYLAISMTEISRLELLVDNVLKQSMLEKDAITTHRTPLDLSQLVKEVLLTLHVQLEQRDAKVNIDTEDGDYTILGDRLHLMSVLYNLIDNALKYSEAKLLLQIRLRKSFNYIELSVTDSGIGIPKVYQDKIFQPFFRVPNHDRHNTKGHGLGLSYIAHIIKLHGGTISVKSEEKQGTTFTIQLPGA